MPLLGLFSRKPKAKRSDGSASKSTHSGKSEAASVFSSTSTEFIPIENTFPNSPNGRSSLHPNDMLQSKVYPNAGASSSRLRLPFSKKSSAGSSTSSIPRTQQGGDPHLTSPRPSYGGRKSMSAASDVDEQQHPLRLPPSKSQIFSESDLSRSTRSLPDGGASNSPGSQPVAKKNNKFPWSKATPVPSPTKTLSAPLPGPSKSPDQDLSSFNLTSFRSTQSTSPIHSNGSSTSLSPPVPHMARPRNASNSSDTSQRISVAAFREAQARRSAAGSPSPSSHPTSPVIRSGAPRPPSRNAMSAPRKSTLLYSSESDESSEDTEDSDHGGSASATIGRKRTVKQSRSTTDLNTMSSNGALRGRASRSELGHGFGPSSSRLAISASSENLSQHTRQSSSTTARTITQPLGMKSQENSDSDDDTPLGVLVPPRRPGSALSSLSGTPPMKPKPLIDITELTGPSRRPAGLPPTGEAAGFTAGSTLLASGKTPLHLDTSSKALPSPHVTDLSHSPLSYSKTPPGGRFISPPSSPERKARDISPAPPPPSVSPAFGRKAPMTKRSTDPTTSELPDSKRPLNERLNSVIHSATTSPAAPSKTPPPPPPKPQAEKVRLPAGPGHSRKVSTGIMPGEGTTEDLAAMLGAGVRLISFNGEEPSPEAEQPQLQISYKIPPASTRSSASTSDEESSEESSSDEAGKTPVALAPVPIQRRAPPSGFSVTSRPQHKQNSASTSLLNNMGSGSSAGTSQGQNLRPRSSSVDLTTALNGVQRSPEASKPRKGEAPNPFAKSFGKANMRADLDATLTARGRSSTMDPSSSRPDFDNAKQIAKTMVPDVPKFKSTTTSPAKSSGPQDRNRMSSSTILATNAGHLYPSEELPRRPFANRPSPASSATGDSSSGRGAPMTPRNGSSADSESDHVQIVSDSNGPGSKWSGGVSGLGLNKKQMHRRSVSYDDEAVRGKLGRMMKTSSQDSSEQEDQRRNDRRRNEARAAIELGNVINGRGPVLDEDDIPINQAMAGRGMNMNPNMNQMMPGQMPMTFPNMNPGQQGWNPMMNMGMPPGQWSPQMGMQGQMPMLSPNQFMMPPPNDPSMYAAHQQAMMMAKQAYQMAVAQQAIAAAGEEWERGSMMGGSVVGGSNNGGGGRASTYSNASPQFMMPGMGMNMGGGAWGSNGSMLGVGPMFSSAQSEYGGGGGGARNWNSSRSAYGESFDPPQTRTHKTSQPSRGNGRESGYSQYNLPPMPPIPPQQQQQNAGRGNGGQRGRTVSQPAQPAPASPSRPGRRAPPPSSWKA